MEEEKEEESATAITLNPIKNKVQIHQKLKRFFHRHRQTKESRVLIPVDTLACFRHHKSLSNTHTSLLQSVFLVGHVIQSLVRIR